MVTAGWYIKDALHISSIHVQWYTMYILSGTNEILNQENPVKTKIE